MKRKPQKAFGAIDPDGHVSPWTIHALAKQVREVVGEEWSNSGLANGNWRAGWLEAKKVGYRVVKLELRIL